MIKRALGIGVALLWAAAAFGQSGYSITGGMSNFDCGNHTDDSCDEFEVEIDGIHPEDVTHTYRNSNYGSPIVLLSNDGSFTIIDYRNPQHLTPKGGIEHFGISLRQLSAYNTIRVRWMRNGTTALVNGQIPLPTGGTAPATQPMLPTISGEMGAGSLGQDGITLSVTNNDPTQAIWIKRRGLVSQGSVTLEQLMTNDPVVTTTVPIDASPILLAAGATIAITSDLIEVEDNETVVFAAEYFQDLFIGGPFRATHTRGLALGNVMTATIAAPGTGCEYSQPLIVQQPASVNAAAGHSVQLQVEAEGNEMSMSYQWLKEGQELQNGGGYSGVTHSDLEIDPLDASKEGFYSVRVTNACGVTVSNSALVFITGHNIVAAPLGATSDPGAQTVAVGDLVMLGATVAFAPPDTTYEWRRNGVPLVDGPGGASVDGGIVIGASGSADALPIILMIDGAQFSDGGAYTIVFSNAGGTATSNPSTLSVMLPYTTPGDMNCDGVLNNFDIDPFVTALLDPAAYVATFPGCDYAALGDCDFDGAFNNFDIDPFVAFVLGM